MMWSAFILGLMGSIHCLAMCGPLVLALNSRKQQTALEKTYYNLGRVTTYCLLGVFAGLFGTGIAFAIGQRYLSIISGSLLLAGLIFTGLNSTQYLTGTGKILAKLKVRLSNLLNSKPSNLYWFGVYNGLLPCGLTYVALMAAISIGNPMQSATYMVLFGIGTAPMMWSIVSGFQRLKFPWISGKSIIAAFTWLLAILLILRGLDLGIPYLSPDLNSDHVHM